MIQAVVFNLESTMLDPEGLRLSQGMADIFRWMGVQVGLTDIRRGRGLPLREHIAHILQLAEVRRNWVNHYGHEPGLKDVEHIYNELLPMLQSMLHGTAPAKGLNLALQEIRERRIQCGATAALPLEMLNTVPGHVFNTLGLDCMVTPCEVSNGRPYPWMLYETAHRMQVYPLSEVVKVGDTVIDMQEGRNAGVWTIGVLNRNEEPAAADGTSAPTPFDKEERRREAAYNLKRAGAHLIIDSLSDLPYMLREIELLQHTGGYPA